jgi:cytochrome c biogenesis protein CcdA/thiol-disulfide isomerase/thioredoxin
MLVVEIFLAFIEGLALIISPCILPILPLVLSTSIDGGKKRPLGIITGFIISFTIFALLSRELVNILHLNLDYIKNGSLILLAILGIIMLSEKLLLKFNSFTQGFANIGSSFGSNKSGYLSGISIGLLIGLVWTPCAGPILAAALVGIIRQQNVWISCVLIIFFAIGAGIPMLIISFMGRDIVNKLKFFVTHSSLVHKILGVIILLSVAFIASGSDISNLYPSKHISKAAGSIAITKKISNGLDTPFPAPQFAKSDIWLNTPGNKPLTMKELKGKVVLVDFWTYSCINCIRTLPYLNSWYNKYHDQGLEIIGVHSPEFEFEKNKQNVIDAINKFQIKYPVAMDNNLDTWNNYNNQYWPAHYLIDRDGDVVYEIFGEGDYDQTENNIRVLLNLKQTTVNNPDDVNYNQFQTPETYLGYDRFDAFAGVEDYDLNKTINFAFPEFISLNHWALSGTWQINNQKIIASNNNAKIRLNFNAKNVYLVLGDQTTKPVKINVKLNGKPITAAFSGADVVNGQITVSEHRLYSIVNLPQAENSLLELDVVNPGVEAYVFTFGS